MEYSLQLFIVATRNNNKLEIPSEGYSKQNNVACVCALPAVLGDQFWRWGSIDIQVPL